MVAANFKPSLSLVLAHEGGYVNHPKDPGGATNKGVTQKVYDAYRRFYARPVQSVRYIVDSEVSDIYSKNYWRLVRGDSLPCGLDYAVFDFAVNSGVSRAVRYLQRLVGVADDGSLGLITLEAVTKKAAYDEEALISQYCANRFAFVRSLSTFATFGKGWTKRIMGSFHGFQIDDSGVIDCAIAMAKRDDSFNIMPRPIENSSRATAPLNPDTFVVAPKVTNASEAKTYARLASENDNLAASIAAG